MTRLWPDKARIDARRIEMGLSQDALSRRAKVGKTTIERILGREPRRANPNTLRKIADALDLPLAEITLKSPPKPVSSKGKDVRIERGKGRYPGSDLPHGLSEYLVGRDAELAQLDQAWTEPGIHLLSIVGVGGSGKTSLVNHWLAAGLPDYRGAESVFVWSFSGQGDNDRGAAADEFIIKAWQWFCPDRVMPNSWLQRADHLAERIAARRNLLVLDGLEVFQKPPGKDGGYIQSHEPLRSLLLTLCRVNQGLCIVTSRTGLEDLRARRGQTAPQLKLEAISEAAGISLLRRLGVNGTNEDLAAVVSELWGHPLNLVLLGRHLTQLDPSGDIHYWNPAHLPHADARSRGTAERIMTEYESWLEDSAELSLLDLLALFEQTVDLNTLKIFRKPPVIPGLTDRLIELDNDDWMLTLSSLSHSGLINYVNTESELGLELHPVVRSYFRRMFQKSRPDAWRKAHARLYQTMLAVSAVSPTTYDEVAPLYQVIRHGCEAGLHAQVFDEVVWKRLMQGFPAYSLHKFNAGELDMLAVMRFFKDGQIEPSNSHLPRTPSIATGRLYFWAGLVSRLHGRLIQATKLFGHAEQAFREANSLVGEASAIAYTSRCLLQDSQVNRAVAAAQRAADIVGRDLNAFAKHFFEAGNVSPVLSMALGLVQKLPSDKVPIFQRVFLFPLADALHHAGRLMEAQSMFELAYRSDPPKTMCTWDLIVGQDAMYYDLLLTQGRPEEMRAEVKKRLRLTPTEASILKPLMHTLLLRAEIQELNDPHRIPELAAKLLHYGEQLDYRCNYQTVRGLLELSATARRCADVSQANRILEHARRFKDDFNLGLLEVELLIEQAALAMNLGDTHTALSRAMQAEKLIEQNGYELRRKAIDDLYATAEQMELVT